MIKDRVAKFYKALICGHRPKPATRQNGFSEKISWQTLFPTNTNVSKDDVRRNRENIWEKLGFLGKIIHGSNPRGWDKELKARIGELQQPPVVLKKGQISQCLSGRKRQRSTRNHPNNISNNP